MIPSGSDNGAGAGVAILGCVAAFLGGAFVIDSVGEFAVGLAVMVPVAIFGAALHGASKGY